MSERDRLIRKAEGAARVLGPSRALRIATEAVEPPSPFFSWDELDTHDLRIAVPTLAEEVAEARRRGRAGGFSGPPQERVPGWLAAAAALAAAFTVFAVIRTASDHG